jgi:hypothetical protein
LYQSSDEEDKNKFVDEPAKINPVTGLIMSMEEEIQTNTGN